MKIIPIIIFFLFSCSSTKIEPAKTDLSSESSDKIAVSTTSTSAQTPEPKKNIEASDMSNLNIHPEDIGYSELGNVVIRSSAEFTDYIGLLEKQPHWNDITIVQDIKNKILNFQTYNLLIYFVTLGSGSIQVSAADPVWEGNNALIKITTISPGIGTTDMAYYAFAYKIKKTIPKVIFDVDTQREEIKNLVF